MAERFFGEIDGVTPGATFGSRQEVSDAGIHGPWQSGIHGTSAEGASSIVASGGYIDDEDLGDILVYTGHGGRDPSSRKQVRDQSLDDSGNAALVRSCLESLPVRVVKGESGGPYTYEGLFRVADYWSQKGVDGFRVWKFRMEQIDAVAQFIRDVPNETSLVPQGAEPGGRKTTITQRVVRSTRVIEFVKRIHGNSCQVCGVVLSHPGGATSEGAHVRPLGRPHDGGDYVANVLCLCPNHHTLLDRGGIWVSEDWWVYDMNKKMLGQLRLEPNHRLDQENFRYHRELWGR